MVDNLQENASHDPMAWQRAADDFRENGQENMAQICHDTAREMMRAANVADEVRSSFLDAWDTANDNGCAPVVVLALAFSVVILLGVRRAVKR